MSVTETSALNARKNLIFSNVDRLMKCLFARYTKIDGGKTVYCELFVKNRHTGREHVVSSGTAHAIFVEQQDVPKAEAVAYKKAREDAGKFFGDMAVFLHLAGDTKTGTECDNINYLNLVVNTEIGA
jgi:hypothetical protein